MSKLPHLPWKGNPTIGWWQDQKYITLYHGTHVSKIPEIVKSGYIKAPSSGPTAGWVSMALEPNTSHGYAAMSGESAFRAAGASARTVPENERAVLVAKVPVSWALSHMNKEFRGNVDWTKTKLTDKSEYEKWKKSDQEYYAVTELRFPDKFPMSFVVGYMSKKGARIDEELEEEILDEAKTAPLYHGAPISRIDSIIDTNALFDFTTQNVLPYDDAQLTLGNKKAKYGRLQQTITDKGSNSGVSLTRDKRFALFWKENGIIFQFDQSRLTNNHKIVPWNFFKSPRLRQYGPEPGESEEFVLGPIKRLSSFVTAIIITDPLVIDFGKNKYVTATLTKLIKWAQKYNISILDQSSKPLDLKLMFKSISEDQLDEGRDAPLYHATSIRGAIDILTDNMLMGNTYHNINRMNFDSGAFPRKNKTPDGTSLMGVSLTRSKKFAFDWYVNGIIFELDQSKLTNNHKIIPTNWWHIKKREHYSQRKEFEEFVLGSIKNLNNYLISITINPEVFRLVRNDRTNIFKSNIETILELAKKHGIPVKNQSGKIVDMSTLTEDAPVTNAGGSAIAGIGVGPNGEPPVKRKPKIVSRALFMKLKDARKSGTKVEEVEEYINGCLEADKDAPIIFVNEDDGSPLYWRYGKKV